MTQPQRSFERLSGVLDTIADGDIADAIGSVRAIRAGRKAAGHLRQLTQLLEKLQEDELMWLEMVLCVRAQQTGREAAWRRFAQNSYRELVAFYR